ncbi:MAG: arginine-tRNA-protein transferase [Ignavibacteriaceae bacterium]|nr:arginine-tRNA-protein transferase [Ignavibacteriaceae bacterium]
MSEYKNDYFICFRLNGKELDLLLEMGFRHFGYRFFRYSHTTFDDSLVTVLPLRTLVSDFKYSKKHKKIINKNLDLQFETGTVTIKPESETLFENHKKKFSGVIPDSIYNFISEKPDEIPYPVKNLKCYLNGKLVAQSFFEETGKAVSSIYGFYDLSLSQRGLGILTILKEIEYAISSGKMYYYLGYTYNKPSFYEYKKKFPPLEYLDFTDFTWKNLSERSDEVKP